MTTCGQWQYNWGYGDERFWGWLYVQGCWSWGLAVTWHVVELFDQYYWLGLVWEWDTQWDCWTADQCSSIPIPHESRCTVEDWMLHRISF